MGHTCNGSSWLAEEWQNIGCPASPRPWIRPLQRYSSCIRYGWSCAWFSHVVSIKRRTYQGVPAGSAPGRESVVYAVQRRAITAVCAGKQVQVRTDPFQWWSIPTAFEAQLFLYTLSVISSKEKQKDMKMSHTTENLLALELETVKGARVEIFQKNGLPPVPKPLPLYMLFDEAKGPLLFFTAWEGILYADARGVPAQSARPMEGTVSKVWLSMCLLAKKTASDTGRIWCLTSCSYWCSTTFCERIGRYGLS